MPDPIKRVIVARSAPASMAIFTAVTVAQGWQRDAQHVDVPCMRRVSTQARTTPYSFTLNDQTKNVIAVLDTGEKRAQIDAVVQLYEQLKPDMFVLVDPEFSEDDLRMRHVPPSPDWFIVRTPDTLCAVLLLEGLASPALDRAFPGFVRPLPPPPPSPPRVVVVDEGVPDAVAAFAAHGIIPLEQRHDISPDDLAAIKDALAANEREHVGRFVSHEELYGGGGGAFINPEQFQLPPPPLGGGVTYGIDVGDDDDEEDGVIRLGGGYLAQLQDLARRAGIPQQQQQQPRSPQLPATITVINNVLDAGGAEVSDGAARRVFVEQRRRDDVLRRNGGPRANMAAPVAAARRGNIGSIARQRIADNANRVQISRAIGKPESRKLLAARKEDPGIEPMATTADDNTCMVCMSTHVTTLLLPCLHMMYCHKCILEWQKTSDKCPSCNAKIESVVQPRTIFNPQEEHTRRCKDPKHLCQVADKLQTDVDSIRERAKTLRETGPVATAQEPVAMVVASPPHPPPGPSVIAAPPSPSLPVLPSRRAIVVKEEEDEEDEEDDDLGSFIEEDDEEGALDDDDDDDEVEEDDLQDGSEHSVLCLCGRCEWGEEEEEASSSSVVEIVAPPPSSRRKRATPSKKKKATPAPKRKKPAKKKVAAAPKRAKLSPPPSSSSSKRFRKRAPIAAVKKMRKGE